MMQSQWNAIYSNVGWPNEVERKKNLFSLNFLQFSSLFVHRKLGHLSIFNERYIIFHSGWLILHTTKSNLLSFLITRITPSPPPPLHNGIKLRWDYSFSSVSTLRLDLEFEIRRKQRNFRFSTSPLHLCAATTARYSFSIFSTGRFQHDISFCVRVRVCMYFTNVLTFIPAYIYIYTHTSKKFDSYAIFLAKDISLFPDIFVL